jgi:cytochrome o ubiquinol oxidase subunit 1
MAYYANLSWHPYLLIATLGAFLILLGIAFQGIQLLISIKERRALQDPTGDPWDGRTLEWLTSSPPAVYNFAKLPVVHEIDALADMKEKHAELRPSGRFSSIEMPKNTPHGIIIGGFALVFGFAMIWYIWWLAIAAALGMIFTAIARSMDDDIHYIIPAAEVERMEKSRHQRLEAILE